MGERDDDKILGLCSDGLSIVRTDNVLGDEDVIESVVEGLILYTSIAGKVLEMSWDL